MGVPENMNIDNETNTNIGKRTINNITAIILSKIITQSIRSAYFNTYLII
jgi:hypothetical protein